MSVNDLVLVQGMHDTKLALRRWNDAPVAVLRPWCLLSGAIAVGLLFADLRRGEVQHAGSDAGT